MKKDSILKATHQGEININGLIISCAVLEDGTRVVSERSIADAIGASGSGAYWKKRRQGESVKPRYLYANFLDKYISKELSLKLSESVKYKAVNGSEAIGLEAEILPEICDVWVKANQKGAIPKSSINTAEKAYILLKGFATVGIIALIDEATGYQDIRVKNALQQILDKFVLEEAKRYEVTYPLELYKQWFRLNNWEWKPENAQKRPGVIGKWTNKYIYDRMAPGLLKELERKNPKNERGYREHKHFSFLTDEIGEPKLREFFGGLIALARASTSWNKYISLVERAYPSNGDQLKLFLDNED
ncbi:MAG: P63C domain-containing protein [Flavobacteriaceae bacterium]|nr:P63C domain-containing protein [Flavobacteriaceae bacterium]